MPIKIRWMIGMIFAISLSVPILQAQTGEQNVREKTVAMPKAMDFSELFDQSRMSREDFQAWKSRRNAALRERLSISGALEKAIDPETYVVGPGDVFSFNVWGALEMQTPIIVNPEGKLLVPSVGEIAVDGQVLKTVQNAVIEKAGFAYEKSRVSLTLEELRYFRVHVVGEVEYPGTYIAQAVSRVSEMIAEAGGPTEWAWKQGVECRHTDGSQVRFDLDAFETTGAIDQDLTVTGGDVIYVPPLDAAQAVVTVKAGLENSGTYQIIPGEKLLAFLRRIRGLKRNTDIAQIGVVHEPGEASTFPYANGFSATTAYTLQGGEVVLLPSQFVYVKGAVVNPGAYPFQMHLTAKDYAGMAGGTIQSGSIKNVKVLHSRSGNSESGPDVIVEAGDVVHMNPSWSLRFEPYLRILPVITSLVLAAQAAGVFGK